MRMTRRKAAGWAVAASLMAISWCLASSPRAATQARLAISAIVVTTCKVVVTLVNGVPVVANTCSTAATDSAEGRAVVRTTDEQARTVTVVY